MNVEEIKQTVTMHDVLRRYGVTVRNNMCCCPIHDEKHPSMKVFKDGYKCFACNSNGDIFHFVMEMEKCDFKTAYLALGGTYEEHANKRQHELVKAKFERNKAEKQRVAKADEDFKKMILDSIDICNEIINTRPAFSDEWCICQEALPWLYHVWDEKYINESEVRKADVIRVCGRVRRAADSIGRPIGGTVFN